MASKIKPKTSLTQKRLEEKIDKLILRISLSEMLYIAEVPPKVSITEGVEIAKEFSTKDSSNFVNGILDAIYNEVYINDIKSNKS